jgi:hypothetical protein
MCGGRQYVDNLKKEGGRSREIEIEMEIESGVSD